MSFDNTKLIEKLRVLNSTQQSIEMVSMYCQVQKRHARQVVATWYNEFASAEPKRKLALLYLANDVLQNSRKKGPEFVAEFHKAMPKALRDAAACGDDKLRSCASRLVTIWDQRRVFGSHAIRPLKDALKATSAAGGPAGGHQGGGAVNGYGGKGRAPEASGAQGNAGAHGGEQASAAQAAVEPLLKVLQEAEQAAGLRGQHLQAQHLLPQEVSAVADAQVGTLMNILMELRAATQAELAARSRAVLLLESLLEAQKKASVALQSFSASNDTLLKQVTARADALAIAQQAAAELAASQAVTAVAALQSSAPPVPYIPQPGSVCYAVAAVEGVGNDWDASRQEQIPTSHLPAALGQQHNSASAGEAAAATNADVACDDAAQLTAKQLEVAAAALASHLAAAGSSREQLLAALGQFEQPDPGTAGLQEGDSATAEGGADADAQLPTEAHDGEQDLHSMVTQPIVDDNFDNDLAFDDDEYDPADNNLL